MATFPALRGALEEDPFLHGAEPLPEDEASVIDYGDTSIARVAGLRQRPRLAADWQEKAAEEEARKRMMVERLTPSPEMLSRVAERSRDPGLKLDSGIASPIPFASAPVRNDVPAPTTGAIAATTPTQPAPPVDGSGGDDDVRNLYLARLAAQSAAGFGGMGVGKNIDMGIADTLGERMKQVEALRAKRAQTAEDRALEQQQFEGANLGTLTSNMAAFKDRPDVVAALENLRPAAKYTKPSDFLKAAYQAVMNPPTLAGKEATTAKTGAQTVVAEKQPGFKEREVKTKEAAQVERERANKAREAIQWAAMNRAAQNAATRLSAGQPETVQKEVRATTQKLGDSIAKEYGEIASALKEADRSLVAVRNQPPDLFAKVVKATSLDGLNTPEERALFRSVGELRRAAQKAQSGLAVTEAERKEFMDAFGQNWLQDPQVLLEAIEWMRRKTKDRLSTSFATYRAQGGVGDMAVRAYGEAGGVTPEADFLLPFTERQQKSATPKQSPASATAPSVGGMVKVRHKASGKTATVDRVKADEMLKRPDFEEVK